MMKSKILLEINQKPKPKLQSNAKFSNPRLPQQQLQQQQLHITTTTTTPTNNATTTTNKHTIYKKK